MGVFLFTVSRRARALQSDWKRGSSVFSVTINPSGQACLIKAPLSSVTAPVKPVRIRLRYRLTEQVAFLCHLADGLFLHPHPSSASLILPPSPNRFGRNLMWSLCSAVLQPQQHRVPLLKPQKNVFARCSRVNPLDRRPWSNQSCQRYAYWQENSS